MDLVNWRIEKATKTLEEISHCTLSPLFVVQKKREEARTLLESLNPWKEKMEEGLRAAKQQSTKALMSLLLIDNSGRYSPPIEQSSSADQKEIANCGSEFQTKLHLR